MSKWIKKGDKVVVLTGNDRGKTGEVIGRKDERVLISGVNLCKKHVKRRANTGPGEIHEVERPIHVSKVSLCNSEGKPVKAKVRQIGKGKELYYLEGSKEVSLREVRKG